MNKNPLHPMMSCIKFGLNRTNESGDTYKNMINDGQKTHFQKIYTIP